GAVIVSGANLSLNASGVQRTARWIASSDVLVLQNEVSEAANRMAAEIARSAGVLVVLNAAPARPLSPQMQELVDVLVVNAGEAQALTGSIVQTLEGALVAAKALAVAFPLVVVTAGGSGVAAVSRTGDAYEIPGLTVTVESTHGAGDEFVGQLATALAEGLSVEDCLVRANVVAAALVATPESQRD
ncbi:MAG: PfkB family carbohydrate kinase, partial [Devosia sp.]